MSVPTPGSPIPSTSIATTTRVTPSTPRTKVWAPKSATTSRTGGLPASACTPSRNSPLTPGRTPAPVDGVPAPIPAIAANERNEIAAQAPKTAAGPDTASSTAATRGPASTAADSRVSAATFDADSSRGDRASSGTNARWQGRWAASGTAASTADT